MNMKRVLESQSFSATRSQQLSPIAAVPLSCRCLHASPFRAANPLPNTAAGPPPSAPVPAASQYGDRVDRRRQQAELLRRGQDLRASQMKPGSAMKKRFWKDVNVEHDPDGHHTIYLDARPVRNPSTKTPLPIPSSKPHLATAIALEWDLLVSAQQALRSHHIPLTSIASRAHDIALQDSTSDSSISKVRSEIVDNLIRYLDTDTLLCWAPEAAASDEIEVIQPSLRQLQIRTAQPIIAYLTHNIWPGVELRPTLDSGSILPTAQPPATQAVIKGWIAGLPAWELAGLERAVLAGKSLCVAARILCEWSAEYSQIRDFSRGNTHAPPERFGIEQAAEACSLEVRWQTGRWGEVEDTHDVEREDLRRQFGSVILVVS
ncbi:MAG: hypothetical protein Q9195_008893 [Heterodermia aff. obscurata]